MLFHPYKLRLRHQLNKKDYASRLAFCDDMQLVINGDETFLSNILFSDESNFYLSGHVNMLLGDLNRRVYSTNVATIDELKQRITVLKRDFRRDSAVGR